MPPKDETFSFDPARMAEAARLAPGYVSSVERSLSEIQKEMTAIFACWESPAADSYQVSYSQVMAKIQKRMDSFRAYPRRLNEVLGINTDADRVASNIAAGIEVAQWAEV